MIRIYIKSAIRNLRKQKLFSAVNIAGLGIGIAAFWIITLYVTDEWSFDRYHKKADRIFRVAQHGKWGSGVFDLAITSPLYAAAMKADYPEVLETARIDAEGGGKIVYNDKQIVAGDMLYTDNAIFKIFSYQFLAGDQQTALARPASIVLTKTLAEKLFGSVDAAIDKSVQIGGGLNKVTGVIADVPVNSHFRFSALRSFDTGFTGTWANAGIFTYVLLKSPGDYKKIEARSQEFYNKYLKEELANVEYRMELQPLTSIHLHSHLDYEISNNGSSIYVSVFTLVALLILGIAIINYINLTTARSSIRMKEIGVRKLMGSGWKQLMIMFITESVLLAVLATALGLLLARLSLPYFSQISGKEMDIWQYGVGQSILIFLGFAIVTGVVSGLYPALFLSGFKAIPALKGQVGSRTYTGLFRKSLVTFQFVITIVMIAGSFVIYEQLNFVSTKDLGFNKSGLVTFHIDNQAVREKVDAIKDEMLRNPLIQNVASAGNPIGNNDLGTTSFNLGPDGNGAPDTKVVQQLIVDEGFVPTMQLKLLQGRNFLDGKADGENASIIVNETLIKDLGWKDPVGMRVRTGSENGVVTYSTIVGVVKDFNTYSLQHKITPVVLRMVKSANDRDNLYIRISDKDIHGALNYLQLSFSKFDKENKADYHFLDENFARQYQAERTQGTLLLIFTVLAITIACLGLFGLVTFTAEQRVKEIGVRKVLGASVASIVGLLNKELIQLVLLATLIASPLAWFAMNKWLDSFAYRVYIHWWVFLLAGGLAVLIALVTITIRSINAALANPVKSLRTE